MSMVGLLQGNHCKFEISVWGALCLALSGLYGMLGTTCYLRNKSQYGKISYGFCFTLLQVGLGISTLSFGIPVLICTGIMNAFRLGLLNF